MSSVSAADFLRIGDEFYAALENGGSYELTRYSYGEEMPVTATLDIFSIYGNPTLRQAIGEFKRKNSGVDVNLRIGMDGAPGVTEQDVIRALNTKILAGKGPDLLMLDGLPYSDYIEKGALKDISGIIDAQIAAGGFMESMRGAYAVAGGVHGIPMRYTLPVMIGNGKHCL
ncbi:MAG: extracellular solute-binding protein [Clostridiales bacterium]|jgi:ABC-type glycerol-3-phosphate transport system substrate-binding protein|nr:extracellular solute-binding protein [Clostridiales bacterium]